MYCRWDALSDKLSETYRNCNYAGERLIWVPMQSMPNVFLSVEINDSLKVFIWWPTRSKISDDGLERAPKNIGHVWRYYRLFQFGSQIGVEEIGDCTSIVTCRWEKLFRTDANVAISPVKWGVRGEMSTRLGGLASIQPNHAELSRMDAFPNNCFRCILASLIGTRAPYTMLKWWEYFQEWPY